jgi:hypothetical protein
MGGRGEADVELGETVCEAIISFFCRERPKGSNSPWMSSACSFNTISFFSASLITDPVHVDSCVLTSFALDNGIERRPYDMAYV